MGAVTKDGKDIADRSREIVKTKISEVLGKNVVLYSDEEMGIIERVVHATADPEYSKLVKFDNNPIESGLTALGDKKPIIADISMVKAGIRYNDILCTISEKEVYELAKKEQITRAVASIRASKGLIDGGIVVIGNAPTALLEVIRLNKEEGITPKLVVGAPVGFVKAAESKELLRTTNIPSISTTGPKGGTPVAVSVINGIIALSKNERI
ncbi:cobalt-precorrin-8 methylmutase [Methanococcus maripaludis]|nr:cobalt-precorrin-8 methylmutase [Methanococcus maripaludis]